jgi:hypothetical protein
MDCERRVNHDEAIGNLATGIDFQSRHRVEAARDGSSIRVSDQRAFSQNLSSPFFATGVRTGCFSMDNRQQYGPSSTIMQNLPQVTSFSPFPEVTWLQDPATTDILRAQQVPFRMQPIPHHIALPFMNPPDSAAATSKSGGTCPAYSATSQIESMDSDSLLHNSCKLYPETFGVVESALQLDPQAIRRPVPTVCCSIASLERSGLTPRETYSYPINIALKYKASLEIIELLVAEGPDVLSKPDGPNESGSLGIALSLNAEVAVIEALLAGNRACASVPDKHANLPLHVAVRSHSPTFNMVERLYQANPSALTARNFNGETPLGVSTRSATCPEKILDFLQQRSFGYMEEEALHLLDDNMNESLKDLDTCSYTT